jgi:hypothetical protein
MYNIPPPRLPPTFAGPKSFRFLSVGALKIPSVQLQLEMNRHFQRIFYAYQTIRNHPRIIDRVRQSTVRRVDACTDSGGGHLL